jgi:hypothetical protein
MPAERVSREVKMGTMSATVGFVGVVTVPSSTFVA